MKKSVIAVAMVAVIGFSAIAQAQHEGRGPGGRPEGRPEARGGQQRGGMQPGHMEGLIARIAASPEAAKKFDITEEQAAAIKDGMLELKKQEIELRKEMELAGLEQAELMTADEINEKAVLKAVEKAGDIHTELAKLRVKKLLLVKKTLTTEQTQAIRKEIQKRMQSHRRSRERDGGSEGQKRGDGEDMERRREEMQKRREEWEKKRNKRGRDRDDDDDDDDDDDEEDDD